MIWQAKKLKCSTYRNITECNLLDDEVGTTHLYAGFDIDGGDLLHDLGGAVEVDDSLVDPHLELVPGLGTLTW